MKEKPELLERVMTVVVQVADDIPLRYQKDHRYKSNGIPVIFKEDGTPQTPADTATELRLIEELTRLRPGSEVISEETVGEGDAWKESPLLQSKGDVSIVDPIDGTCYFYRDQSFGMLIGLRQEGIMQWAIAYYPREREFLYAMHGHEGAFHCAIKDGQLSEPQKISMPLLAPPNMTIGFYIGPGSDRKLEEILDPVVLSYFKQTEPSLSVAIALRQMLLTGDHVYLYNNYKPWDFEITALIARQAGADVTHFDGRQSQTTQTAQNVLFAPRVDVAALLHQGLHRKRLQQNPHASFCIQL